MQGCSKLFFFILFSAYFISCATTDRYKGVKLKSPPVERGFVYSTQNALMDAGEDPIVFGGAVVSKNVIYLATANSGVEAVYNHGFQRKWQFQTKNGVGGELLLQDNVLYFGANDGSVYALETDFGKVIWKYETKSPVFAKPTVAEHRAYFASSDDVIHCIDAGTGKWLWHYKRGGSYITTIHGNSSPVVDGGIVYVGFSDGYVVALNAQDGNLKWEQKIHTGAKFTDVDAMPVIEEDRIYIPSYDGGLYALSKNGGKILWKIDVGGSRRVVIEGKLLYLGSSDGHVYAVNKDTGKIEWKFALDDGTPTNLVIHQSYVAFGSSTQYFYIIHKGDGSLAYRYSVGMRSGFVSSPVLIDKNLYALSKFGNLYEFKWVR